MPHVPQTAGGAYEVLRRQWEEKQPEPRETKRREFPEKNPSVSERKTVKASEKLWSMWEKEIQGIDAFHNGKKAYIAMDAFYRMINAKDALSGVNKKYGDEIGPRVVFDRITARYAYETARNKFREAMANLFADFDASFKLELLAYEERRVERKGKKEEIVVMDPTDKNGERVFCRVDTPHNNHIARRMLEEFDPKYKKKEEQRVHF